MARQHGGTGDTKNLALACAYCNRHKGPNLSGVDPQSSKVVRLFNPRTQSWGDHFAWNGAILSGLTPVGRATVRTLAVNDHDAVLIRELLMAEGAYGP